MATKSIQVVIPKNAFDKRLSRAAQMKVWEYVGQTVEDEIALVEWCKRMADDIEHQAAIGVDDAGKPLSEFMKLRLRGEAKEFHELAHRVRKETILDRTVPVLARVDVSTLMRDEDGDGPITAEELRELWRSVAREVAADPTAGRVEAQEVEFEEIVRPAQSGEKAN